MYINTEPVVTVYERAIEAAKEYAGRNGMVVLEPVPGGFHAYDDGEDIYVVVDVDVAHRRKGPISRPSGGERRRARQAGWRLDLISLKVLTEGPALLRHLRNCSPE